MCQIAGQETEAFACFNGGTGEDDAPRLFAFKGVDGRGNGKVSLAGTGRTDAEGDVVGLNLFKVFDLARRAAVQIGLARHQRGGIIGAVFAPFRAIGQLDQAELDFVDGQFIFGACIQGLQCFRRFGEPRRLAAQGKVFATARDGNIEGGLDLA